MHIRNTHVHIFTQTIFFRSNFYADYPSVSIFTHILLPLGRCGTCFASEDLGEDATG